jgi:hypothetical protein
LVWVDYNPTLDTQVFREAIAAGAPVVVFAIVRDGDPPAVTSGPDSFITGCPTGPLLGYVSRSGEWASIESLHELVQRLEQQSGGS